jgi:hypothetical protein
MTLNPPAVTHTSFSPSVDCPARPIKAWTPHALIKPIRDSPVLSSATRVVLGAADHFTPRHGSSFGKAVIPQILGAIVIWGAGCTGLKAARFGVTRVLPAAARGLGQLGSAIVSNPGTAGALSYGALYARHYWPVAKPVARKVTAQLSARVKNPLSPSRIPV